MTLALEERRRDRLLALLAAAFAATLIAAARGIEDSLLSDSVGAGGVPQGVGLAMAVAALALFAKSFRAGVASSASEARQAPTTSPALLRTAALVFILLVYALLLPWLGYALTVSLLVLASGRLAGASWKLPLWSCAAVAGPGLWLLFDRLLQVRMPVGSLWGG